MENTKTQTLIERFNMEGEERTNHKGEKYTFYPQRNRMKFELERLLSLEIGSGYLLEYDNQQEKLNEYKENFEWDTKYAVSVDWEICAPSFTKEYECSSVEQIQMYLDGREQLEEPDWEEDSVDSNINYGDNDFTGENDVKARVRISNLRLKKPKYQYAVQLVIDCEEALPELELIIKSAVEAHNAFTKAEVVSFTANT